MGLTIRMLLSLALAAAVWVASLGAFGYFVLLSDYWFLALLLLLGFAAEGYEAQRRGGGRGGRGGPIAETQRAERAVERVALVAGVPVPEVVVEPERPALSWTLWAPWGQPRVHVTSGLLERLDDEQLAAVAAHELMHVINRDAQLMTAVGLAPSVLLDGLREMIREHRVRGLVSVIVYGFWFTPSAVLLLACARIVSRHRELVADAGAARLTGSPAAVAGALLTLSEHLAIARNRDLRDAGRADLFHFLPRRPQNRLWATHPPTAARLARLQRLEHDCRSSPQL